MPGIHKGSGWLTYAAGTRPTRMKMKPRAHARPGRPWMPPRTQFRDMAAHPVRRWKQCPDARSDRAPCQEADSAADISLVSNRGRFCRGRFSRSDESNCTLGMKRLTRVDFLNT